MLVFVLVSAIFSVKYTAVYGLIFCGYYLPKISSITP